MGGMKKCKVTLSDAAWAVMSLDDPDVVLALGVRTIGNQVDGSPSTMLALADHFATKAGDLPAGEKKAALAAAAKIKKVVGA